MNSTPTEIWTHIFAYASADDRRTARSLGEVSRYVREATRGVGMERVVLRSVEEVVWFAGYLEYLDGEFEKEREEGEKVRVKALDIALDIEGSDSPEAEGDGWLKWLKEGKERSTWGDDIPSFDTYITQSRVRGMAACDALERILKHIGGGVRDMSVWWNARYERRFGVLPIGLGEMGKLERLVVRGDRLPSCGWGGGGRKGHGGRGEGREDGETGSWRKQCPALKEVTLVGGVSVLA